MDSKSINSPLIDLEDGTIIRLLPNIDKYGIVGNPCHSVNYVWYNEGKYMFTDDRDFPIVNDINGMMWEFKKSQKDLPFNITTKYYMYCMDYKFDVKIFRFGRSILNIIEDKIKEPFSSDILNPKSGKALKIKRSVPDHGFPSFEGTEFIDVEPFSIGKDASSVNSYIMNSRETTIEALINSSSWYRGSHRREIIQTLLELDPVRFEYIKKFNREDLINDLLGESG